MERFLEVWERIWEKEHIIQNTRNVIDGKSEKCVRKERSKCEGG